MRGVLVMDQVYGFSAGKEVEIKVKTIETCTFMRTQTSIPEYGFSLNDGEIICDLFGSPVDAGHDWSRSAVEAPAEMSFIVKPSTSTGIQIQLRP
jgi:hypothetical protein